MKLTEIMYNVLPPGPEGLTCGPSSFIRVSTHYREWGAFIATQKTHLTVGKNVCESPTSFNQKIHLSKNSDLNCWPKPQRGSFQN